MFSGIKFDIVTTASYSLFVLLITIFFFCLIDVMVLLFTASFCPHPPLLDEYYLLNIFSSLTYSINFHSQGNVLAFLP